MSKPETEYLYACIIGDKDRRTMYNPKGQIHDLPEQHIYNILGQIHDRPELNRINIDYIYI